MITRKEGGAIMGRLLLFMLVKSVARFERGDL
jgi:hypothetical protein